MTKPLLFIVEGINDERKLQSMSLSLNTYAVGGFGINKEKLEFIKSASHNNTIVLLLDPDPAGEKLRSMINTYVGGCTHIFINQNDAKDPKRNNIGIECMDNSVLHSYLKDLNFTSEVKKTLSYLDLLDLKLVSSPNSLFFREALAKKYHLGHPNGKQLLKRLNILGITKEELINTLKGE